MTTYLYWKWTLCRLWHEYVLLRTHSSLPEVREYLLTLCRHDNLTPRLLAFGTHVYYLRITVSVSVFHFALSYAAIE